MAHEALLQTRVGAMRQLHTVDNWLRCAAGDRGGAGAAGGVGARGLQGVPGGCRVGGCPHVPQGVEGCPHVPQGVEGCTPV